MFALKYWNYTGTIKEYDDVHLNFVLNKTNLLLKVSLRNPSADLSKTIYLQKTLIYWLT